MISIATVGIVNVRLAMPVLATEMRARSVAAMLRPVSARTSVRPSIAMPIVFATLRLASVLVETLQTVRRVGRMVIAPQATGAYVILIAGVTKSVASAALAARTIYVQMISNAWISFEMDGM